MASSDGAVIKTSSSWIAHVVRPPLLSSRINTQGSYRLNLKSNSLQESRKLVKPKFSSFNKTIKIDLWPLEPQQYRLDWRTACIQATPYTTHLSCKGPFSWILFHYQMAYHYWDKHLDNNRNAAIITTDDVLTVWELIWFSEYIEWSCPSPPSINRAFNFSKSPLG
jgi:hypothetical protein